MYDEVWTGFDSANQPHDREELGDDVTELVRFVGVVKIGAWTGISGSASQPATEKNEVNEVTRFVRDVGGGDILREAFWCSNLYL